MINFSQQISDFKKNGIYNYNFDVGGNLDFVQSSSIFNENYVSLPLIDFVYDNIKVTSFYNISFTEFIPTTSSISSSLSASVSPDFVKLIQQNQLLMKQITSLSQLADSNMTQSEILAIKQVIINLRIQLNQGVSDVDFSTVFPYIPLTKPTN